jgi:alkanesulfonate monooxygenase SsuD/methylene tetrahydromethanopterin reductase-like flavin-dependent oxidoreductase (luciferase family)
MSVEDARASTLWGAPDQAVETLRRYRELGVTHFILSLRAPYESRQLELFMGEVVPALKQMAAA